MNIDVKRREQEGDVVDVDLKEMASLMQAEQRIGLDILRSKNTIVYNSRVLRLLFNRNLILNQVLCNSSR